MAKAISSIQISKSVPRPGIHSKTKTSKSMNSKLYKKPYRGQGR